LAKSSSIKVDKGVFHEVSCERADQ
jgi:hypothetical protein